MICPSCESEYRAGYTRCASCDVDLVEPAALDAIKARTVSPRAALADVERATIAQAGLAACREIESALLQGGVPAYVEASQEEGEALSAGTMRYGVVVAASELQAVSKILRGRFEALLAREGTGAFQDTAVDLNAETVTCPACGHTGALVEGACGDCGLGLGIPDP
jgi:hypothetical protein